IPPADVTTPSGTVHWHPCLLAEVTPHDGPTPTGNHVWDDNNLGQKNITIVDADAGSDFAIATVIGHEENKAAHLVLEINRGRLPREVELYVDLMAPVLRKRFRPLLKTPVVAPVRREMELAGALADSRLPPLSPARPQQQDWRIGRHKGQEVILLRNQPRVQVPIDGGQGRLSAVIVGGIIGKEAKPGRYEIVLIQRNPSGEISGSAELRLTIGKR